MHLLAWRWSGSDYGREVTTRRKAQLGSTDELEGDEPLTVVSLINSTPEPGKAAGLVQALRWRPRDQRSQEILLVRRLG